jgi:hypothetical protein
LAGRRNEFRAPSSNLREAALIKQSVPIKNLTVNRENTDYFSLNHYQRYLSELSGNTFPMKVGATSLEEQVWCRWFGREIYTGNGVVVEWGPWLGSLTKSCCEGLEKNPAVLDKKKFFHVYDLFKWSQIFELWSGSSCHAGKFREGDDFYKYFCGLHQAHERFLNIHQADLSKETWSGEPVEWIINDAVKSIAIGTNVFRQWVPCMIPGKSWIAHQDYLWSNNSFIQIYMFLMRDCFIYEYSVPNSCMVIFKNVKTCDPRALVGHGLNGESLGRELINEAFDWAGWILAGVNPRLLALCRSTTLHDFGFHDEARRIAVNHHLDGKTGDAMIDFQLNVLQSWGYPHILVAKKT